MAIFYCQTSLIRRSKGRSATAAVAYRAAEKIMDERTGIEHNFERKKGVLDKFIFNSAGLSRSELWNIAEMSEKRSDSRVAREWTLALPHELRRDAHRRIIERFSLDLIDQYQVAVDVCIHAPGRGGDHRNLHAHLLMTTRSILTTGEMGKQKTPLEWSDAKLRKNGLPTGRQQIDVIRERWASIVNHELGSAGFDERISHLSLKDQGIEKIPQIHIGPLNTQLARMGYSARASRWQLNEEIKAHNNVISIQTARIARMQNQPQNNVQNDALASQKIGATFGGLAASPEAVEEANQEVKQRMEVRQKSVNEQREEERWKPVQIDPAKGSVISMFQQDSQGVYRWTKGRSDGEEAFRDIGKAIHSRTTNSWALAAELELAQQKVDSGDWKEIRAFGSDEYRRAVWIQGQVMGLNVEGYKPTKTELEKYAQAPAQGLVGDQKSVLSVSKSDFQSDQKFQSKFEKTANASKFPDGSNVSSSRSPKM